MVVNRRRAPMTLIRAKRVLRVSISPTTGGIFFSNFFSNIDGIHFYKPFFSNCFLLTKIKRFERRCFKQLSYFEQLHYKVTHSVIMNDGLNLLRYY